jgi:predicted outer membrane repeat protein
MKRSRIPKVLAITLSIMTVTMGILNSAAPTWRAKAFSALTVTNTSDSGAGSLRDAVSNANSGDKIVFSLPLPATIILTTGEIAISQSLTIAGPGANVMAVSGSNSSRVFRVGVGAEVSISGLGIFRGSAPNVFGGAIFSEGALSVTNCDFSSNTSGSGGAIAAQSPGSLAATGCTFENNSAVDNGGAILASGAPFKAANSTFTENLANNGGAIYVDDQTICVNCTFFRNVATPSGGGGIFVNQGALNLQNSIIALSRGGDCMLFPGATIGTNSHNLIQDGSCSPMLSGDPMLGPLLFSGGPTATLALLAGSPAMDAGDDGVLGSPLFLTTDQRGAGFPRKSGAHVDIGAFEFQEGPSFDTCLKDNKTGNLFQFDSTTGQYQFAKCSDGFTLSGTGRVALVNGIRKLTDKKPDRKISAAFNTGQLTGNATIYLKLASGVWQHFRVHDTNPSAVCKC